MSGVQMYFCILFGQHRIETQKCLSFFLSLSLSLPSFFFLLKIHQYNLKIRKFHINNRKKIKPDCQAGLKVEAVTGWSMLPHGTFYQRRQLLLLRVVCDASLQMLRLLHTLLFPSAVTNANDPHCAIAFFFIWKL